MTPLQTTIVDTIRSLEGELNRSELAKLLCGSNSARTAHLTEHAAFGVLKKHSRKSVLQDIDILIQQGVIGATAYGRLVLIRAQS